MAIVPGSSAMTLLNNAALAQEIPMRENACALIMHGLNTNPERMSDIAALLDANNFKTLIGRLTGHDKKHLPNEVISSEQWKTDFMSQWKEATSECSGEKQQRVFVGYSLGALTALTSFDTDKGLQLPTKMILFSPAITFRFSVNAIRALSWLPFGSLPSVNHPDYRARPWTSLKSYKALFQLHDEWYSSRWKNTSKIPTLVVLSAKDELVDSQQLAEEIVSLQQRTWAVQWVSNEKSELRPRYHHLMIDRVSLGHLAWQNLSGTMTQFLRGKLSGKEQNAQ
jgi:esterase/lipase